MSILSDVYKIPDASVEQFDSRFLLSVPYSKQFTFDIDSITSESSKDVTIFWNFGDPFSSDNEVILNNIIDGTATHTFNHAGIYKLNTIANIDGILFHVESEFEALPNTNMQYVVTSPSPIGYYASPITASLYSYDLKAKIYYKIIGLDADYNLYTGPIVLTNVYNTVEYYMISSKNITSATYTTTYNIL